jgi:hypothetical protein
MLIFQGRVNTFRIVDGGFVRQRVRAARRVALDDVKGIAVIITGAIEPRLFVEPCDIDDQRVTLPSAVGPTHPTVDRCLGRFSHVDQWIRERRERLGGVGDAVS